MIEKFSIIMSDNIFDLKAHEWDKNIENWKRSEAVAKAMVNNIINKS